MTDYKIAGHCTICDAPCFEIIAVYEAHERLPGEPKTVGPPLDGATRISYMLMDGTKTMLTFCAGCTVTVSSAQYVDIWRKVIRSWTRELSEKLVGERNPEWYHREFANGILCEMGRVLWTEAVKNG